MDTYGYPKLYDEVILTALIATDQPLEGLSLALIKADFSPSPTLTYADLEIADFDGYETAINIAFTDPFIDGSGVATAVGGVKIFEADGDTTPNTIFGWMLFLPGIAPKLVAVCRYENPIGILAAHDGVAVAAQYQINRAAA